MIDEIRTHHVLCPKVWINCMEALRRYIRHAITLARVEDFQTSLESKAMRVNLLRPDLSCPNIDQLPLLTPLVRPEPGIIYLNSNGKRRFMRISQLSSFSDGTLFLVRNILADRLAR